MAGSDEKALVRATSLPKVQISIVILVQLCEAMNSESLILSSIICLHHFDSLPYTRFLSM